MLGGTARGAGRHDALRRDPEVARATGALALGVGVARMGALAARLDHPLPRRAHRARRRGERLGRRLDRAPRSGPDLPGAADRRASSRRASGSERSASPAPACTRWREYGVGVGLVLAIAIVGYVSDVAGIGEAIGLVGRGRRRGARVPARPADRRRGARGARLPSRMARPDAVGDRRRVLSPCSSARSRSVPSRATSRRCAGLTSIAPFASLAIVLGWVVLRTGALWPAIAAHAVLNLATITAFSVGAPAGLRLGLAGATLVALVVAADVAGQRSGRLRPVPERHRPHRLAPSVDARSSAAGTGRDHVLGWRRARAAARPTRPHPLTRESTRESGEIVREFDVRSAATVLGAFDRRDLPRLLPRRVRAVAPRQRDDRRGRGDDAPGRLRRLPGQHAR